VPSYLHTLPEPQRAWRATHAEVALDDTAALALLGDPTFDPLATVLIADAAAARDPQIADEAAEARDASERAAASETGTGGVAGAPPASARVLSSVPGRVVVATDGPVPGWLVFSDNHFPGWRATIDGAPTAVRRADVALMAVEVPAGQHTVELRFASRTVSLGLGLSIATALAMVVVAWRAWPAGRRRSTVSRPGIHQRVF
jgi:hypothetical protein